MNQLNIFQQVKAFYNQLGRNTLKFLLQKKTLAMGIAIGSSAMMGISFQNCAGEVPMAFTPADTAAFLANSNPLMTTQGPNDIAPAPSPAPSPSPGSSSSSSSSSSGASGSSSGISSSSSSSGSGSGSGSSGASSSSSSSSGISSSSSGSGSGSGSSSGGGSGSGSSSGGASSGVASSSSGSGSSSGAIITPSPTLNQPTVPLCSNDQSMEVGGNVVEAPALAVAVVNVSSQKVLCTVPGDYKSQISKNQALSIDLSSCKLPAGDYGGYLYDSSKALVQEQGAFCASMMADGNAQCAGHGEGANHPFVNASSNAFSVFTFTVASDGSVSSDQPKGLAVLWDLNSKDGAYAADNAKSPFNGSSNNVTQAICVQSASPLIMSLDPGTQVMNLTSPLDGVLFNLLGENAAPANTPVQISWFPGNDAHEFYFLVLPDVNGNVNGIDQMFGNNTKGPDGKFADNGYEALGKYDMANKGYIDSSDAVYGRLRLWKDSNSDGKVQSGELFSLREKGVKSINWRGYNAGFSEKDQWGNMIKYKSIFRTSDGASHLMFDIWFVLPTNAN